MAFFKPPLRDRTVLYLLSYTGYDEAHEVPQGLTQMGMARALGCKRAQVAQVLIELKGKGMARERVCHVRGSPRRMKAFVLTPEGRGLGENLRRSVLERTVQFVDEDGEAMELTAKEVLDKYPRQLDITAFMRLVDGQGGLSREQVTEYIERGHKEDREEKTPTLECESDGKEAGDAPEDEEETTETPPGPEVEVPGQAPTHLETESMEMGPMAPVEAPPELAAPPTYYYGPAPVMAYQPPPPPQPRPRSLFARGSLLLGFTLMFIGGIMPFTVGTSEPSLCVFAIPIFILGIVLMIMYYISLRLAKVEHLTTGDRYSVLIVALILAYILGFLATLAIDYDHFKWDLNVLWSYLLVQVPLCFALGAYFLIPAETRGQLGVVIGTFLIALSVGGLVGGGPFSWLYVHPVMWMVTGVLAASVGNEVGRPDRRRTGLWVSTGLGIYMIVAALALMNYVWGAGFNDLNLHTSRLVVECALALWVGLGAVVIGLRAAGKERLDGLFSGLGYTALVCVGTAFFLFGIWFMKLGRFEGAIDLLIGLPVVYYSLVQLKDSGNPAMKLVGALMGYAIIVEALSLGLALKLF
jgi:hypothetical protein